MLTDVDLSADKRSRSQAATKAFPVIDTASGNSVDALEVLGTCRLQAKATVKPGTTISITLEAFRRWTMQASSSSECPSEE